MSLECCEYDLAVFAPSGQDNRVMHVDGLAFELLHLAGPARNYIIDLGGMQVLKDTNKFDLSSAAKGIAPEKYRKVLCAAGKKSLISSLFLQQQMRQAKLPTVAAMWLKLAAYEFIEGMLALSESRPMPLHELQQVRRADAGVMTEGVEVALECIGIERATRSAISRSVNAIKELKSKDYDRNLFVSKVNHLLSRSMLADSYYYAGKVAAKNLVSRKELFYNQYAKLVKLALDLSSDMHQLEKLQKLLFRAANGGLKG
jgi:hypothetical protein